ncbi:MAG: peptidase [Mycobacterium sp.]|nr:peptidase [Mycobacterium sp.]
MTHASQLELVDDLRIAWWAARDQGDDDACVLFAATVLHEVQRSDTGVVPLSELSLTPNASVPKGGFSLSAVCRSMYQYGQLNKLEYENIPTAQRNRVRDNRELQWMKARLVQIDPHPDIIATHLKQGSAVLLGLRLTRQFRQREVSIVRASEDDKAIPRRHAVSVVARANAGAQSLFLVRNSWGERWGQNGYAFLDSKYIQNQGEIAAVIDGLL